MKASAIALIIASASAQSKFNITLGCLYSDRTCAKVKEGFNLAAKFLENALNIRETIKIKADYSNYRNNKDWGARTLGKGSPATKIIDDVVYPQALLKQLPIYKKYKDELEEHDVTVSINSNHDHFFPSDYNTEQENSETTFLDTVCHEILHGMGISSSFSIKPNKNFAPSYIMHTIDTISSFTFALTVFETSVYTQDGKSIAGLVKEMNKENANFTTTSLDDVKYNQRQADIASSILSYAQTPNGLYFRTKSKKKVYLETNSPFLPETSIAHIASKYNSTTDRVMAPRSLDGTGIHDISKKGWKTSPFGTRVLLILQTMGYCLNPNPKYENSLGYFSDQKRQKKPPAKYY